MTFIVKIIAKLSQFILFNSSVSFNSILGEPTFPFISDHQTNGLISFNNSSLFISVLPGRKWNHVRLIGQSSIQRRAFMSRCRPRKRKKECVYIVQEY